MVIDKTMKTKNADRLTEIIEKLKVKGLRLTPQRLAVLKILVSNNSHPTVDEVYTDVRRQFPMTSLATVYKTIAVLKELEEVAELRFDSQANRYDGVKNTPHPHLICSNCRKIMDAELESWPQTAQSIQAATGFQVSNYRMDIFGLCSDCQVNL